MIGRYLNSDLYMKIDCIMTLLVGLVMGGLISFLGYGACFY